MQLDETSALEGNKAKVEARSDMSLKRSIRGSQPSSRDSAQVCWTRGKGTGGTAQPDLITLTIVSTTQGGF